MFYCKDTESQAAKEDRIHGKKKKRKRTYHFKQVMQNSAVPNAEDPSLHKDRTSYNQQPAAERWDNYNIVKKFITRTIK